MSGKDNLLEGDTRGTRRLAERGEGRKREGRERGERGERKGQKLEM